MNLVNSDKLYFEKYIDAFNIISNSHDNLIGFIKNSEFIYSAVSQKFRMLAHKNNFCIEVGLSDFDISVSDTFSQILPKIREYDCQIRGSQQQSTYLYISNSSHNIFIINKYPIINPNTGNFLGVRAEVGPFLYPHPLQTLYNINGLNLNVENNDEIEEEISNYNLTERQHMVLYLYLHRYSYTQIAELLTLFGFKISPERVNDHLASLKTIFLAKSKNDLITKAIAMKYHLMVPRKLLKFGIYKIEDILRIT